MLWYRFAKAASADGTSPPTVAIALESQSLVWDATEDADAFYAIEAFGLVNVLAHTLPKGTMVAVCRELVRRYPTAVRAALPPEEQPHVP